MNVRLCRGAANGASTAVRVNRYYGDAMSFFRLTPDERAAFEQARRTAKLLMAVAVCLIATDIVMLLRTPLLNVMALVGLVTSLVLLGASIKLLLDDRSEKRA